MSGGRYVPPTWLAATGPDDLVRHRQEIVGSGVGGASIDHESIVDELPEHDGSSEPDLLSAWFDVCLERIRRAFACGPATVYRAIAVEDRETFVCDTIAGRPVGVHWTWCRDAASTGYHGGECLPIDVLLTASVEMDAVDWATTLQQNFAHPHEREIRIDGHVLLKDVTEIASSQVVCMGGIRVSS